jgi:arginase
VHVDVDVIDPDELPGLLFPAPGGPSAAQVVAAVRRILATGRVTVLDIACPWHPTSQDHELKARAGLVRELIGAVTPR